MNKSDYIFKEEQRFRQPWLWILMIFILGVPLIVFGISVFLQIYNDKAAGIVSPNHTGMIIEFAVIKLLALALLALMYFIKLTTLVKSDGIYIRFSPFMFKSKVMLFTDIASYAIRKYKPISEYGGWGIRLTFNRKGSAYNISGNIGLQLELKNKSRILIGTQKPDELLKSIDSVVKSK